MLRECNTCQECCIHINVVPLNKPAGIKCKHLCKSGCGIYAKRPEACAQFTCSWLDGYLPDALKPEKCGLLFETTWIEWPRKIFALVGFENKPKMLKKHAHLIKKSLKPGVVAMLITYGKKEQVLIGAADDIRDYQIFLANAKQHGSIGVKGTDGVTHRLKV
jgi:hypothetical protein